MSETSNTIPPKGYNNLTGRDLWMGALMTVFPHIVALIIFALRQDTWPSWPEWRPYVEISVVTFLTYIGKNWKTNNVGQLFTDDKPTTMVSTKGLKEVIEEAKT